MTNFFKKIIGEIVREELAHLRAENLKTSFKIARLVIDAKNNNLTLGSRAFLMQAGISPDEFSK